MTMTEATTPVENSPLVLHLQPIINLTDEQFFEFCQINRDLRIERMATRERSGYRFPELGEVYFVKDADSKDALVMMASLVGKYVRELLMTRIWRYYATPKSQAQAEDTSDTDELTRPVSGYNDPRTGSFVTASQLLRQKRRIPSACFQRAGD